MVVSEAPAPWWAPDVIQMWTALVGWDGSTPPLHNPPLALSPPFVTQNDQNAWMRRWQGPNMVRISSFFCGGCREFLTDSTHALCINRHESLCSEFSQWVSFSLSDIGWLFHLTAKMQLTTNSAQRPKASEIQFHKSSAQQHQLSF